MRVLIPVLLIAVPVTIYFAPEFAALIYNLALLSSPVWLPVLLWKTAWPLWLTFVRSHYVMSVPYTTIELKPGAETPRSARAMELVFYSLYHRTEVTLLSEYLLGHVRVPWSFEVMAHDGMVRFFAHIPTAHREAVEARLRNEYRDIDIDEIQDYSREIPFNPLHERLTAREYVLARPDPYPLKTYAVHEELQTKKNPLNSFLETMLAVPKDEYLLISWIVRPHQREREGIFRDESRDSLHDDAHHEITHLLGPKGDIRAVSPEVQKTITAIEHALKKPSFDCGVRAVHIGKRETPKEDAEGKLDGLLSVFNDAELNAFKPYNPVEKTGWPFSEFLIAVPLFAEEYFLQLFRRRAFFAPPYYGNQFVLNTEELATVFHLPHYSRGSALASGAGRFEPPENLPV